jgi:hypothetical protein
MHNGKHHLEIWQHEAKETRQEKENKKFSEELIAYFPW